MTTTAVTVVTRVVRCGNSLCVRVGGPVGALGLAQGDMVRVTVETWGGDDDGDGL